MAYQLPALPYDYTALEPYISKNTLEFHHDKHHAAYVTNYNKAVEGTELDALAIEDAAAGAGPVAGQPLGPAPACCNA